MLKMKIIKSGFKSAWTHKLRAFFMILGIMIGIAALTVIISLGKGTEEKVMSQVKKLFSSNTIIVVAGAGEMEGNEKNSLPPVNLKISDMEEIADNIENIIEWDAVQIAPEKVAKYKGRNTIVTASGQTATAEEVWNIVLTDGRFFTESENKSLARVALIAPNVQKELFGDSDPIGNQIKIDNIPFQVIGTIAPRGMDPHGIDKDSEIIVPLNTLLRRVVNLDYLMLGKLLVADESIINSTAEQVTQKLRETHNISDNENDDFMAITPEAVKEMIKEANKMFNLYLPIVAVVSLLVGSIVVANLMLISVNERIKEIGLRKAVGAKSKDILTQFLIETSSITLFSGFTGVLVGMIILTQITKMMDLPFTVSWVTLTACFVISTFIGVVSGIVPAMRASRLEPVTSLK